MELYKEVEKVSLEGMFDDSTRTSEMLDLYNSGSTLESIGVVYGITRERVRQILGNTGVYEPRRTGTIPWGPSKAELEAVSELFINTTMTLKEMSAVLGLSTEKIQRIYTDLFSKSDRVARQREVVGERTRNPGKKYTGEDFIKALRRASSDLGTSSLGIKKYSTWRNKQPDKKMLPSPASFSKGEQSWNSWKIAAGLTTTAKNDWLGIQKFSNDDLFVAINDWAEQTGRFPSISEAGRLRKPGQPSVDLIRKRFNSWLDVEDMYLAKKETNND